MHQLSVPLNRQQLELLDRTLARGIAGSRADLLKLALHDELSRQRAAAAKRLPGPPGEAP